MADARKKVPQRPSPSLRRAQRTLRIHPSHFIDGKDKPREDRDLLKAMKCMENHARIRGKALELKAATTPRCPMGSGTTPRCHGGLEGAHSHHQGREVQVRISVLSL